MILSITHGRINFEDIMSQNLNEQEVKEALKKALKEWLDDKILAFGWMSLFTVSSVILFALAYFVLKFYPLSK